MIGSKWHFLLTEPVWQSVDVTRLKEDYDRESLAFMNTASQWLSLACAVCVRHLHLDNSSLVSG